MRTQKILPNILFLLASFSLSSAPSLAGKTESGNDPYLEADKFPKKEDPEPFSPTKNPPFDRERGRRIENIKTKIDGPNCWGSVLYVLELNPNWTYVAPDEFDLHLKHSCREISFDERKAGDVGVIQHIESEKLVHDHAFIFENIESGYSKKDYKQENTFSKASLDEIGAPYGLRSPLVSPCIGMKSSALNPSCGFFYRLFRCRRHDSVREHLSSALKKELAKIERRFSQDYILKMDASMSAQEEIRFLNEISEMESQWGHESQWFPFRESLAFQWMAIQYQLR